MTDHLDVNPTAAPIAEIRTEQQALNWVNELTAEMMQWREQCNVVFPGKPEETVKHQRRAMWTFLVKHGELIGALKTLRLARLIPERAFKEYNQRAINTLIPDVVGST